MFFGVQEHDRQRRVRSKAPSLQRVSARSGHSPTNNSIPLPKSSVDNFSGNGAFGTLEHLCALHPQSSRPGGLRRGVITFARREVDRDRPWREWTVPVGGDAILQAEELFRRNEITDLYVSQAAFRRWRGIADLTAIGACYVDLDFHTRERWRGRQPRDVAFAVTHVLEEAGVPLPSYILGTGRGLCCVWLCELLPPTVLPRWNLVQRTLADHLTQFGADKRAIDAARVFRVVGSENAKADWDKRIVTSLWHQGSPESPYRYDFGSLADEVLPFTQSELISLRSERKKRALDQDHQTVRPALILGAASYWSTVHDDIQKLRLHRNPESGALAAGHRDTWIFVAAVALSWLAPATKMSREIGIVAAQAAGWTDKETHARMSAVIKRAKNAEDGKLTLHDGREVDPKYRMRASTIVDWLAIEPSEMRAAGLRVLVDDDIRRELNTQRTSASRRRKGSKDRGDQRLDRLELGQKCRYLAAKDGMSVRDLAAHFQVSTGQISKAMSEARQAPSV